jgi:Spy/CpxP family protein refolding chaperone
MKVLAFLALTSLLSYAQPQNPPDPAEHIQHRVSFLSKHLSLTPAQQQQATTIFTDSMAAEKSVFGQMRTAHESLKAAIEKNDTPAIDQLAATIGNLTAQLTAAHAKADAAFSQILTPDQRSKFAQMEAHGPGPGMGMGHGMGQGMGHGRHGGPGGPPPGAQL